MFRIFLQNLRTVATLAVVLFAWMGVGEDARAGCGDHGYVVQRAGGEVVVVTPSNPRCPCKGLSCQKQEVPAAPFVPPASTVSFQDAWKQLADDVEGSGLIVPVWPGQVPAALAGFRGDIFQPPRA